MENPDYRFAARMQQARPSFVREILKAASRTDMISFAGGLPAPELFDVAGLRAAANEALDRDPVGSLQYSATEGHAGLRARLSELMAARGAPVAPEDLIVTTGSQQGIDIASRVFLDPGDTVVVERPTYLAALQIFNLYGVRLRCVEVDRDGLDVDGLERAIVESRPKLVYLVATFANPSGATLSLDRRRRVLEIAAEHRVIVVEDDPYSELRFAGETLPPLIGLAPRVPGSAAHCVYLSSLSKIVSPGLRVAWMALPPGVRPKATIAKQASDLHTSSFTQAIAYRYLGSGRLADHVPRIRERYRERAHAMTAALERHLPAGTVSFDAPDGGMFLWARLSPGVDTARVVERAVENGVVFVPGAPFYAERPEANTLRLSFATPTPDQIDEGVRRLAEVVVD